MPYRVELTARAARDLDAIFRYIHAEQSQQAARWFNNLHEALDSLRILPHRSPAAPENPAFRHLLYGNKPNVYRIIYSIDEAKKIVTVLTLRHGARQPL